MSEYTVITEPNQNQSPRALLVAVQRPQQSDEDVQTSCAELESLARTLGITVVQRELQNRTGTSSSTYVGSGKLEELARLTGGSGEDEHNDPIADLVLVDGELSPRQQRTLELALEVEVMDRTAVILHIFERRAQTREAKLEVEIARLEYQLPRIRDDDAKDDRQGGGGRGERGHTNVELDKERTRDRIAQLNQELADVQSTEASRRERRQDVFQVALVGYTNAGKSSLMRGLTGSEILVEDKLFATLGTTVRKLQPAATPPILLSDTVGFIKNLPHELVQSFRSTLDEAKHAQLLLLVVDVSDSDWRDQLRVTRQTLESIGAGEVPRKVVLNKIDRLDDQRREQLADEMPDALQVSALDSDLVRQLRDELVATRDSGLCEETIFVPFTEGQLVGLIHAEAHVLEEAHIEEGTVFQVRARPEALDRWRSMLPDPSPIETVDELLEVARLHGLELMSEQNEFDTSGPDYQVVRAEDDDAEPWILRAPRRPDVFDQSRVEARMLRLVAAHLPVGVPDWRVHARQVIAYPLVDGKPARTYDDGELQWHFSDPQAPSTAFLDSVASMLVALQSIPEKEATAANAPVQTPGEVRETYREQMASTRAVLSPSDEVWARWERWLDDDAGWPRHTALVHGDLHPGHLLLDQQGRLSGVIDWTEAKLTDPSVDLAPFYGCFGEDVLDELLERFEEEGGRTWPEMRRHIVERWAFNPVLVAAWALEHGDEPAIQHAKSLLEEVASNTAT
jgi:GTP-binding protein HflX